MALVKYADSDSTKDPVSDEEKIAKGKKNDNAKGQQHNPAAHGNSDKRKADSSLDFVANTNAQENGQRHKGKQPQRGGGSGPNLERLLNQPCPKHGSRRSQHRIFGRIVISCGISRTPICSSMIMARPTVQEVVSTGRVTEVAVPV